AVRFAEAHHLLKPLEEDRIFRRGIARENGGSRAHDLGSRLTAMGAGEPYLGRKLSPRSRVASRTAFARECRSPPADYQDRLNCVSPWLECRCSAQCAIEE